MSYSIIIPLYNEDKTINLLINQLKPFSDEGNEVIVVNDGSDDNTSSLLSKYDFIKIINLKKNFGKGVALKIGILISKYNKIIIYDGDLELETQDISKLMILKRKSGINSVFGNRFKKKILPKNSFDLGNLFFTSFFNLLNMTCYRDILCCAKAFYKHDIPIKKVKSIGFDIDIELTSMLNKNNHGQKINHVWLDYNRRSIKEGKKLKISDGWKILVRIIFSI